ncbi:hypothetical protein D7Y13_14540 [Corallococcus praedator]|uniref:Secreted protein n=1 Tax=Corallococcus praedator TaxID=2316724 RepID=A0ABX9QIM0_9BACT|nr:MULTISPECIES: hypothetical protein [Corallococcus]RKH15760.1 hypothetical protein D7X74_17575 [Corallococcus sp. CA047B]RKH30015.1 hypothetical protein D7X75_21945 [Corallococcus sp. CA031C]RKI09358.1 hypothetical protein D7Y13_14540 [Corallococcus praedator]
MKTLTVAIVFCLSMVSLFASVRADANAFPRLEPGVSQPVALMPKGGDGKGGGDDKGGKGGEEDEEEYRQQSRGLAQKAALELVDPGVLDDMIRLRAALRGGQR